MTKIGALEDAARAADAAMAAAVGYLRTAVHPTSEGARKVIMAMLEGLGYDCPEGLIAAGGVQSAEPHHSGEGALLPHTPIVIDIFPRSRESGYFGDLSRTVCVGQPSLELVRMYDAVQEAQELALSMVRPGALGADIQRAVEDHFAAAGFATNRTGPLKGEGFIHSVGHGVGTQIHESPRISPDSKDVLAEGDVITVEPGLYYKDIGGVRIEDMVEVVADGHRLLTHASKKLTIQ